MQVEWRCQQRVELGASVIFIRAVSVDNDLIGYSNNRRAYPTTTETSEKPVMVKLHNKYAEFADENEGANKAVVAVAAAAVEAVIPTVGSDENDEAVSDEIFDLVMKKACSVGFVIG